jgi:hypothetical protein
LRERPEVVVAGRHGHRVEVTAAALHTGDGQRQREADHWRDGEQAEIREQQEEVAGDVAEAELIDAPAEIREVFVAAVREIQRDHPDEIREQLRAHRHA